MRFADIRTEWRVDKIETDLYRKAESHELSSIQSDVASMERAIRDLNSLCDGLRSELQACQEKINSLEIYNEHPNT